VSGVKRMYVLELLRNKIYRLSDTQDINAGIDANYNFAVFVSDSDWVGNGNEQSQLFFLNSYRVVAPASGAP
jgi:hypothetical protein